MHAANDTISPFYSRYFERLSTFLRYIGQQLTSVICSDDPVSVIAEFKQLPDLFLKLCSVGMTVSMSVTVEERSELDNAYDIVALTHAPIV